jgi:sugar fermentation stimulation protein A
LKLHEPLLAGRFLRRHRRFFLDLELADGAALTVHCANTGSMEGCHAPGALVLASAASNPRRKLSHTAEWIRVAGAWVGINTVRANRIVGEALAAGRVPELAAYREVRAEVPLGRGTRLDFALSGEGLPPCLVEVKNATWPTPDGGIGFPDAVSERGLKHVQALRRAVRGGARGVLLFLVNRDDGGFFRPAFEKDPRYARALVRAAAAGVELLAYRARIAPPEVFLGQRLDVRLRWR